MKIILKIEELFNKGFYKLGALLKSLYKLLTPQKVQNKIIQTKEKIAQIKEQGILKVQKRGGQIGEQIKIINQEIKEYKLQEKVTTKSNSIKEKLATLKERGVKENLKLLSEFLKNRIHRFRNWATGPQIKITFGLCTLLVGLGHLTYGQIEVFLKESGIRSPASIPFEPEAVRPNYYKMEEKLYSVFNVILPIFIESKRSMTSVKVDMTIRTSNRQTILYLRENDSEIRDYMHTRLEPMVPTFPIEAEGRAILKQKLIDELNLLLKEDEVEGHVEDIYLKEILGG